MKHVNVQFVRINLVKFTEKSIITSRADLILSKIKGIMQKPGQKIDYDENEDSVFNVRDE